MLLTRLPAVGRLRNASSRQLSRKRTSHHGSLRKEGCVDCGARAGQAMPPNVFHPDHRACKCGGRGGAHEGTEYDWPWHATEVWQYELRQRLCTWKEVCKNEEEAIRRARCGDEPKRRYNLQLDDCSEDPEWGVIQTSGSSRHGLSAPGEGDLEPQLAHRMSDEAVCTS